MIFSCLEKMAHKKAAGSAKNLRDSNPNYHWVKVNGGQFARAGNIIIRQQWAKYRAGEGVYKAKDFTLHARIDGVVSFRRKAFIRFDGRKYERTVVEILPSAEHQEIENKKQDAPSTKKATNKVEKKPVASAAGDVPKKADKKAEPKTEKAEKSTKKTDSKTEADDLTKIEGIGPKIAEVFASNGIKTYEDLSGSKVGDLRTILADNSLSQHDPSSWKKQATLAKNGKRDELKILQDELDGGK